MAKRSANFAVQQESQDEGSIDPMDLMTGVVLLIAIPLVAFVVLSMAGLSPRKQGMSAQEAAQLKEEGRNHPPPPMTKAEAQDRIKRATFILEQRVPLYMERVGTETIKQRQVLWETCALRCARSLKGMLNTIRSEIKTARNPELARYAQQVAVLITKATELEVEIGKTSAFGIQGKR